MAGVRLTMEVPWQRAIEALSNAQAARVIEAARRWPDG